MIRRALFDAIKNIIGSDKAIIIMGPRQVGKSTLLHTIFDNMQDVLWLNGDDIDVQRMFVDITSTRLKAIIGNHRFVIVDEAQRITDIGLRLKLITDQIKDVQLIATGSSSFRLASQINESLTGRKREFLMLPMSFAEMVKHTNLLEEKRMLPHRLIYGYYPEVVTSNGDEKTVLKELSGSYLYKDILSMDSITKPDKLVQLLQALAFQIGSQVSYNEISRLIGLDVKTIERYIDILEKNYVIFRIGSFSRNLRNELKSSKKIYFYDNGIRNALIANFSILESRGSHEIGALWENFIVSERMKYNEYTHRFCNIWFWRTNSQKEIDLIEEEDGQINAYEFKWNSGAKYKYPSDFMKAYPNASFKVIHSENIEEFLL